MNKPVAWMVNNKLYQDIFEAEHYSKFTNKPMIPLYTHPVKELTDDEIMQLWKPMPDTKTYESDVLKFAKAILRKAQEYE